MSLVLTKYQKQELGRALAQAGYEAAAFVYTEDPDDEGNGTVTLTNRDTFDSFTLKRSGSRYTVQRSVPGTGRTLSFTSVSWLDTKTRLQNWAAEVKRESEAVDPWEQEAEDMANDDSYFSFSELAQVDKAIENSLDELKRQALEHGVKLDRIETELHETKLLLEKSARNATKKEWLTLFKGLIVEKLVSWGMQTALFQGVLQTLITSAHDIAQLAEHASRHLLN